jgi:hypothetical protein
MSMKSLNINNKLNCLMNEHGIDSLTQDSLQDNFLFLQNYFEGKKLKEKDIIIRGSGIVCNLLINKLSHCFKSITIVDQSPTDNKLVTIAGDEFPVVALDKINTICFSVILCGVLDNSIEIKEEYKTRFLHCEYINIESILTQNGFSINDMLFRSPYHFIMKIYNNYQNATTDSHKCLQKMISFFLTHRDLYAAKLWINVYIEKRYPKTKKYIGLLADIILLEDNIKEIIYKREKKDIVWNWLDALEPETLKDMKFLNLIKKDSLIFKNSFTVNTRTRSVFEFIHKKKLPIDDYYNDTLTVRWPSKIEEDYEFIPCTSKVGHNSFFKNLEYQPLASQIIFEALQILIDTTKPLFLLLHFVPETHKPWLSPYVKKDYSLSSESGTWPQKLQNQITKSAEYLDVQLQYLKTFLSADTTNIYMSDHGSHNIYSNYLYKTISNKVVCFIHGKGIIPYQEDRLFSLYKFSEILSWILEKTPQNYEQIISDECIHQAVDYQNQKVVDDLLNNNEETRGIAYRGIRRQGDMYILLATGKEFYFCLPDDETNHINSGLYKNEIAYLREKTGNTFINVSKNVKFKSSRNLYRSISEKYPDYYKMCLPKEELCFI